MRKELAIMKFEGVGVVKEHWIDDDETTFTTFTSLDQMCHELSKFYAFRDLDDSLEIIDIYWNGKPIHYAGWQPDMVYEFCNQAGEVIWRNEYPNWEH